MDAFCQTPHNICCHLTPGTSEFCKPSKPIKSAFNKESLYEISPKLGKKIIGGTGYSSQIVCIQFLNYTHFFSAICPLRVPGAAVGLFVFILSVVNHEY